MEKYSWKKSKTLHPDKDVLMNLETLPPEKRHLAWRLEAACEGEDPGLFMLDSVEDLGFKEHNRATSIAATRANKEKFALAVKFCEVCSVTTECYDTAVAAGDLPWGVRGGHTPFELAEGRAGRPVPKPMDGSEPARRLLGHWEMFSKGISLKDISTRDRALLGGHKRAFMDREPDATWDKFTQHHSSERAAGEGWVVSQSHCRSVVRVLFWRNGQAVDLFANSRHIRYDDVKTPKTLLRWPEGMDWSVGK